jgi:uncharacterized protein
MNTIPDRDAVITALRNELPYLHQNFGVKRLSLFGSVARGTAARGSDVDLLVELIHPLGFKFVSLANYLEKTLGFKVDLATMDTFHRSKKVARYRQTALEIQSSLIDVQSTAG